MISTDNRPNNRLPIRLRRSYRHSQPWVVTIIREHFDEEILFESRAAAEQWCSDYRAGRVGSAFIN